jgi:hypothetical protein
MKAELKPVQPPPEVVVTMTNEEARSVRVYLQGAKRAGRLIGAWRTAWLLDALNEVLDEG